ncbi:MAG: hypothetical protein WCS51_05535 [Bacilli bacterium]
MKLKVLFYFVFAFLTSSCVVELEHDTITKYSRYILTMNDINRCVSDAITFESFVKRNFPNAGVIRNESVLYINIPIQDEVEFLKWVRLISVFHILEKVS